MDGCLELINSLLSATLPWQVSKLKELGGGGGGTPRLAVCGQARPAVVLLVVLP